MERGRGSGDVGNCSRLLLSFHLVRTIGGFIAFLSALAGLMTKS